MKDFVLNYLKEEAQKAKEKGLNKKQFVFAEIIKGLYYLFLVIGASAILFYMYIFFYMLVEIIKSF